ncbi:DUF2306 domain-containing protein [Streptosporangium algeriense]|uniref:DUF2306 domain-containing protein n=1 Tax=Streptosporangium algeriense TaxID=1682748 RepID=A0ABW3DRD9_9ACTN
MTTSSAPRTDRRRWWWALWGLMAVSALGVAAYAVPPYLSGNPADSNVPIDPDVALHYLSLAVHAVPGGLALIIGPSQFMTRLRARNPGLHRVAGRIYMISVLAASGAAVFAATFSLSGLSVRVAFYLLVVAWLYTLAKSYRSIRRGDVRLHQIWLIRNYALTFAAVTLRVYLLVGLQLKRSFTSLPFDEIYNASAWASILVNVIVAEYFVIQRASVPSARREAPGGHPVTTPAPAR